MVWQWFDRQYTCRKVRHVMFDILKSGFQSFHGTHQLTSTPSDPLFGVQPSNPPTLRSKDPSLPQPVGQSTYRSMHAQSQPGHFTDDAATITHRRTHIPVDRDVLWHIPVRPNVLAIVELSTMSSSSLCSTNTWRSNIQTRTV